MRASHATLIVAVAVAIAGCNPSPPERTSEPPAAASGTRVVAHIPGDAQINPVLDDARNMQGVTIARENSGGSTLTCQCSVGACAESSGAPCKMERQDEVGWTKVWCTGSCYNSEGNPCGGCGLGATGGGSGGGSAGAALGSDFVVSIEEVRASP